MKYEVTGTSRTIGAIGIMEPFTMEVVSHSSEGATEEARRVLYAQGREHVFIQTVTPMVRE